MSRDPEDPRPPRKPKAAQRPSEPAAEYDLGDASSTWRPTSQKPKPQKEKINDPERPTPKPTKVRSTERLGTEVITPGPGPAWWERIVFGQVSSGLLAQFCRQFASYLNAGVDILKTLGGLEKQFQRTALGPVITRMGLGIRRGSSLSDVVANEPGAFDQLFLSLIRVAETRGGVPETLNRMGRHYEARQSLIRQARSAMIYPITVLVIATAVVVLATKWLLPMFVSFLKDLAPRTNLPLPSRVLMGFSEFMGSIGWLLVPAVMVGVPIFGLQFYKTAGGKRFIDEMALYIPVLGAFLRKIDTTRFAQTLSTLQEAGVDVGTSLDLTADVMRLDPFRRAIRMAKRSVLEGGDLSSALANARCFNPDVIAVLNSGEETGKLPESLERLAHDYEEQVALMVRNMGQLIQPLVTIMLGGAVLFIILAVFLPFITVITTLSQ